MARHDRQTALPWPSAAAVRRILPVLGAWPRALLADLDGTLAPIAPTPEAAELLPGIAELLARAIQAFELVAVISGRSAADVRCKIGVSGVLCVGNHGLERLEAEAAAEGHMADVLTVVEEAVPYVAAIEAALDLVRARLDPLFSGIRYEPKGVTASIHVRGAGDPDAAEAAVYEAACQIGEQHGLRVTRGKRVVELRPPLDVDKGVAVAELVVARGLRGALYFGDDATDLDAFRALRRLTMEGACQGLAVAVLHPEAPAGLADEADLALDSIERMPSFLGWVLEHAE
jgi:trehalose 6-phosphate phosphatase